MRILYGHYLPKIDQPAGHMIHAIARELRQMGHEVAVHASAGEQPAAVARGTPERKRFASLRAKLWFAKAIARDLARRRRDEEAVKRIRPDIILVRQDAYCSSLTRAGHRLGVPVVTYADAPVAYEARQRNERRRWHPPGLVEAIEKWGLRRSEAVIAVSGPAAATLRSYGLPVPIHVIPNGIDPARFPRLSDAERQSECRQLSLTAPVVVAFQGTFQAFHGIDRLQDLMLFTARRTDTQWLLIGDGPERPRLERAVSGKVPAVFLGRQPSGRVGQLLALADVGVAPYSPVNGSFYGCPLKVLEYSAAGCAVLTSGQGDVPALLDGGRAGVVVAGDDPGTWTEELRRLLDDEGRRRELGRYAREWAMRRFTWRHTAERLCEVMHEGLKQAGASRTGRGRFAQRRYGAAVPYVSGEEST